MAYPVVEGVAGWAGVGTNATSHGPITLPSGIVAGELLVCLFAVDGSPTCTASAGWDKLGQASYSTTVTGAVFWKVATGSDALTVTTSASEIATAIVYRLSAGWGLVGASANGSSVNADPPPLTPAGGAGDYLWLAGHCSDSTVVASAAPSGYGSLTTRVAASTGGASISAATKAATTASENPGAFTTASEQWVAWTLAVALLPSARIAVAGPLGQPSALAHLPTVAALAVAGPLGEPSLVTEAAPSAVITVAGPLGTPAARAQTVTVARLAVSSPLGRPSARAHLPTVAAIAVAGPLGVPRLRARHRQTRLAWLAIAGPLGAPRLLAQQRVVTPLPAIPDTVSDARQRLLSDPFPLRRSIALPDYREDVILPWVYGRATLAPVALDAAGLEWLVADHPIVAVTAVRDDGAELDGWQLVQQLDATGVAVALLRLTQAPKGVLAVDAVGRRHPVTGAALEHPADIAEDLLTACGWQVPAEAFAALRDVHPGVVLAGVLNEAQSVREAVSRVLGSVDADWSASPLRAWLPEPGASQATLTPASCDSADAATDHASLCTRLRVSYAYDWSANAPRGSLTVTATDRLAELGEIAQDLDLPWVRTARDALALATAALSRRARPRWTFDLALPLTARYRPGDTLTLDDPWVPRGAVIVTEVERGRTGQRLTAIRYAGEPPRVELTGRGQLLDAAGAEPVRIDFKDGVATFTILNELGAPLAGASVTLDERDTRTTDRAGQVQFATTRGLHTLLVVANGYANLELEVTI